MSFELSMKLLNFLMPRVILPSGNRSPTDLVILKSHPKHQASVQYPIRESNSGHVKFLSCNLLLRIYWLPKHNVLHLTHNDGVGVHT